MIKSYGHVRLTDTEFQDLKAQCGEVRLRDKIKTLNDRINKLKNDGKEYIIKSDTHYRALLRINEVQLVQPIRSIEKIEELKEKLKQQSHRNYFLLVLGLNIGVRIGDLLKLRVKDLRGKTYLTLIEQKTSKKKQFRINPTLQKSIEDYIWDKSDDDYLFPSQKGHLPITRVQAYRILKTAAEEIGLERIGSHSLRKSMGYHMYQKNKDTEILRQIFNHSSPSITQRYIGVGQDEIDKAFDDFSL